MKSVYWSRMRIPSLQLRFLEVDDCTGCELQQLPSPLVGDIMLLGDGESRTIRVNGAAIYSCSRLSFMSKGFRRPFIIIESMTDEIFKAEKSAYEKVIRMIAHEVNNSVAGVMERAPKPIATCSTEKQVNSSVR